MANRVSIASTRRTIEKLLPSGHPTIDRSAGLLQLSPRTLQRRLERVGVSYGRLLAEIRLAVAQRRLGDPHMRIADVSAELGYRDPSSFSRAFVRWTGMSPRAYRRSLTAHGYTGDPSRKTPQ
jgi:AraC-like DNA-binding protein